VRRLHGRLARALRAGSEHAAFAWAISVALLILKAPDAFLHPQFWAEDGAVFFAQQHGHAWPLLFTPYAGYLLVVPRLVAWCASALPVAAAPAAYAAAALALGAAGIASLRILERLGLPFWLALATVALTPTNVEVFGNLTNAQWLLQFVLLGAVLRWVLGETPPARWRRALPRIAALIAIGLTGPFCIFATIAVVAGLAWSRLAGGRAKASGADHRSFLNRAGRREVAVIGLCAVGQLLIIVRVPELAGSRPTLAALLQLGQALQRHLLGPVAFPAAATWSVLGVLAAACLWTTPRIGGRRAAVAALLAYVVSGVLATAMKFGDRSGDLVPLGIGERYFLAPKLLAWWLFAIWLSQMFPRAPGAVRVAVLLLLIAVGVSQRDVLQRPALPSRGWARRARAIERGEHVVVPIHPKPWQFEVGPPPGPNDQ
jgi:hypothetical protein